MKKSLLVLMALLSGAAAHAETVTVAKFDYRGSAMDFDLSFDIYKPLGRAWVSATYCSDSIESGEDPSEHNYNCDNQTYWVDGLHYDSATNQILYKGTVCVTVKHWFLGDRFQDTGNCVLKLQTVTGVYDDGTRPERRMYNAITLDVKNQ